MDDAPGSIGGVGVVGGLALLRALLAGGCGALPFALWRSRRLMRVARSLLGTRCARARARTRAALHVLLARYGLGRCTPLRAARLGQPLAWPLCPATARARPLPTSLSYSALAEKFNPKRKPSVEVCFVCIIVRIGFSFRRVSCAIFGGLTTDINHYLYFFCPGPDSARPPLAE